MPNQEMSKRRFTFNSVLRPCALLLCLLMCLTVCALAQEQSPKRGFNPGGSYAISDIETVSTTGGNLSLRVPLSGLPAGRGGMKASVNLFYNSKLWDTYPLTVPAPTEDVTGTDAWNETRLRDSKDGGWRYAFQYDLKLEDRLLGSETGYCQTDGGASVVFVYKLFLTLPDGSKHEMHLGGPHTGDDGYTDIMPDGIVRYAPGSPCPGTTPEYGTLTYYSGDATFLRLDIEHDSDQNWTNNPWTLYLPDGGRVTGGGDNVPQRIYDRNNNYIEVIRTSNDPAYGGHNTARLSDQVGRSIVVEYNSAPNQDSVHARGTNNELVTTKVLWTNIQVNKSYRAGSPTSRAVATSFRVVSQIILPTQAGGLSYTFSYNAGTANPSYGWGEVSSVTLPSGAKASYQYLRDGADNIRSELVLANHPTRKDLVYRREYDGTPVSNTPCNTQTETTCTTETTTYGITFNNLSETEVRDGWVIASGGGVSRDYVTQSGDVYKSEGADGTVVERQWQSNIPQGSLYARNQYVKREFTSIRDAAGNLTKTAIKEYSQDKNGNVTQVKEYDWVAYGSLPRDANGRPDALPAGAQLKRVTNTGYYNPTPNASDSTTADPDSYHLANTPRLHGLVQWSEVQDGAAVTRSRTEAYYDNTSAVGYVAATIGNLTQQKSWDSTKGAYSAPLTSSNSVSTSTQYNGYGSPTLTTDARGTQTELTYGAVNGQVDLYPTITKVAFGTAVEQVTNRQYDFYTGAVTQETDPNNVATVTEYDVFGRPKLVKAAAGITAKETRTATDYSDTQRRVIVRSDLTNTGDGKIVSIEHYDQMGRVRLSRKLENAATENETLETDGVKVQTRYVTVNPCAPANTSTCLSTNAASLASYVLVSNPYRAASSALASSEPSMGWTRSRSDKGGRAIEAQTFNGAALPAPWGANASSSGTVTTAYEAEFTTVTDQAGKMRRSMTNALGQLARVDEPDKVTGSLGSITSPVQPTSYTYDALGNLTQVTQDTQTRTFNYSSLSLLTSAINPESGTVSYTYDEGGNLRTKTDARPITITYTYDALSRNKTVDYSNTTVSPDIDRYYDNPTSGAYGRGRYWYDYKGGNYLAGSEVEHRAVDSYDALGRPLSQRQMFKTGGTWSGAYTTTRTYKRAGLVETQTLPSGHAVSHTYDAAGRLQTFTGNLGDGMTRTYSTGATYDAAGRMTREEFGTGTPLFHKKHYNTRGQLYDVRLSAATDEWSWNRGAIVTYYDGAYNWSNSGNAATGADNNGNVTRAQAYVPGDDAVTTYALSDSYYDYDALNRLKSVSEYKEGTNVPRALALTQGYDYDRWGNRTINQAGTTQTLAPEMRKAFTVDTVTNRLGVPTGQTGVMTYDAAGNLTDDQYTGAGARTYDAENRMTAAVIGINSSASYSYDAEGKRMRRSTPNGTVWQTYGFDGELLAEYAANAAASSPQKEYGYRAGELLVTAEGGATSAYLSDLAWTYSAADYYSTTKDLALEGTPLTLNGTTYSKGLSVHANAEVRYALGGNYQTFAADIGVDDYVGSLGSVIFEVWADGTKLYDSGVMTGATATKSVAVGVVGKQELKLVVTQAGDGPSYDHADWAGARLVEAPAAVNVAAASQGATASASSVYPHGTYTAPGAINGDRKGENWGAGGGWNDGTADSYPDWVQVDFAGVKTIDEVDVFTGQDNYANPSVPTETMTFSLYGLTAFEVQYWTGSAWATVQNGSVTGNDKVWRKFNFPAVTTSKIRVYTSAGLTSYSRVTEIEAYESKQAAADVRVQWLVADHLGTPRMIANLSGSLAGIKRHDYLPFGEEIGSGTGGRTTAQGYVSDNVRQQFTSKERDAETGLDYFGARYYTSSQGRFTSCDPVTYNKTHFVNPQRWNLYVYVTNNPLAVIDPDGRDGQGTGGSKTIDVYLNFTTSETQKYNNTADWAATKREVEKNGEYKLVVHSRKDFTQDNLRTSLANSAAVLIVGDAGGIPDIKRGTYTAVQIDLADGAIITSNGYGRLAPFARENPETGAIERGVDPLTVLPQNNTEATGIFACNASSVASGLNSNGQNVVANTGGPDGLTSATALVSSAQSFAKTFSTTGSVRDATTAANSVLRQSQGHGALTVPGNTQMPYNDRGDRLVPIPKPGQQ